MGGQQNGSDAVIEMMLIAVIVLQVFDFATTAYALQTRSAIEANPLMARLMDWIGVIPALILTKGTVIGLAIFLWRIDNMFWLGVLLIAYAVVGLNNLRLITTRT
jgi:hypothetical protein